MDKDSQEIECVWKGEWVARSEIEVARPCLGSRGEVGPDQQDFGGIQTAVRGKIAPVEWSGVISNPQDAQEHGFKMVDDWLKAYGPKLREANLTEIEHSRRPTTKIFASFAGKHPLPSYEEYRSSCERQRKSLGAQVPVERKPEKSSSQEHGQRRMDSIER